MLAAVAPEWAHRLSNGCRLSSYYLGFVPAFWLQLTDVADAFPDSLASSLSDAWFSIAVIHPGQAGIQPRLDLL
jgi:hypothetical protein